MGQSCALGYELFDGIRPILEHDGTPIKDTNFLNIWTPICL